LLNYLILNYIKIVLQQHRLTKSNTDLNMLREQETNSDLSMPIQKGLTFDMWLAHKLRLKRLELKKKKDEAKLEIIERYLFKNKKIRHQQLIIKILI